MRLKNVAEKGATVFISDLGLRINSSADIDVPLSRASSTDLQTAVEQGLISVSFTDTETADPRVRYLRYEIEQIIAKRGGEVLAKQLQEDLLAHERGRLVAFTNPFIRPAVLVPIVTA